MTTPAPRISVVIPTRNRAAELRLTLQSLREQTAPAHDMEVVVVNDGSTDETPEVVREFGATHRVRHLVVDHDEADIAAHGPAYSRNRNLGVRLATAPLLAFLDSGTVAGPDFVAEHQRHHQLADRPAGPGVAVIGYTYGYNPEAFTSGRDTLKELVARHSPMEAVERIADQPLGADMREPYFDRDLSELAAPWLLFWSLNISMSAADFWAVGGFDEDFRGWGHEDIELGYRLTRHGVRLVTSRTAWAFELPIDRVLEVTKTAGDVNMRRFLTKHRQPLIELCAVNSNEDIVRLVEDEHRYLTHWAAQAHGLDVRPELEQAARALGVTAGTRTAVIGCGPALPPGWPDSVLLDFDADALAAAANGGRHTALHGIGLRTELPESSVDLVLVTSRMGGVWDRWGDAVLAEAHRFGRRVHVTFH